MLDDWRNPPLLLISLTVDHSPEIRDLQAEDDIGDTDITAATKRVARGHSAALHGRLQSLREFHQQFQSVLSPCRVPAKYHWIFSSHQQACRLGHCTSVAGGRSSQSEFGNSQPRSVRDPGFLQSAIGRQRYGSHRRCHGDFVGSHGGFRKVGQRTGRIVPLHKVADQSCRVLGSMRPFRSRPPFSSIDGITHDHEDRRVGSECVVNRHRGVLYANRWVHHRRHGLACNSGVAVSYSYRGLFVAARQEFRVLVSAIINNGLVQPPETRGWHGSDVLDPQGFDDVHHEVRSRMVLRQNLDVRGNGFGFGRQRSRRWQGCRATRW